MISFALDVGTTATPESYLFYFLAPLSVLAALGMLFDAKCASKEYSDCDKPGARSEEEFSLRVGCLKAAGKN